MSESVKPLMESLEPRLVPARDVLVIDFTPDVSIGRQTLRAFCNNLPEMPDGRGQVWARKVIVANVARIVNPLGTEVIDGEGPEWLARGRGNPNLFVTVINVGGYSAGDSLFGQVKRVAPVGTNIEGNGWVFSGSVANWGWEGLGFCKTVAATITHEAGHLRGLGHNTGPAPLSLMTATVNVNPDATMEETPRPMLQYRRDGSQFVATVSAAGEWRKTLAQPSIV